jgi:dihydrofolate reductase
MAELIADLFVSLDGFGFGIDVGPFFDYGGPELERWTSDQADRPQLVLMGRVTYDQLAKYASAATDEGSVKMNRLPKVVFSNTLQEPLTWTNTRLVRGDLAKRIAELKRESSDPIRTFGSMTLVRGLMELGLVDRLRLMVFPLVVGADIGREPIFDGYRRTDFELVETTVLDSRLILLDYRPATRKSPLPGETRPVS